MAMIAIKKSTSEGVYSLIFYIIKFKFIFFDKSKG